MLSPSLENGLVDREFVSMSSAARHVMMEVGLAAMLAAEARSALREVEACRIEMTCNYFPGPGSVGADTLHALREIGREARGLGFAPTHWARGRTPKGGVQITRRARVWIERTRKATPNESFQMLLAAFVTRNISDAGAARAADQIIAALVRAGQFARAGDLTGAIDVLNDPAVLAGTPFRLATRRDPINLEFMRDGDERAVADQFNRMMRIRWSVSTAGAVTFPRPPSGVANASITRYARREWIRTAMEELGHAAEILNRRARPNSWHLATSMRHESRLHADVAFEARRLREERAERGLFEDLTDLVDPWETEADVYAFMIEVLGEDFVSPWYGINSGYRYRRVIDRHLGEARDHAWDR